MDNMLGIKFGLHLPPFMNLPHKYKSFHIYLFYDNLSVIQNIERQTLISPLSTCGAGGVGVRE